MQAQVKKYILYLTLSIYISLYQEVYYVGHMIICLFCVRLSLYAGVS
jgi:hypothetical protein